MSRLAKGPFSYYLSAEITVEQQLREALSRIQQHMNELYRAIDNGPVPGAYFPLQLNIGGTVSNGTAQRSVVVPVQMLPVAFTAALKSGTSLDVDLSVSSTSIFASGARTITSAADVNDTARSQFASGVVAAGSRIDLDITNVTSSPADLELLLVGKRLGKIKE